MSELIFLTGPVRSGKSRDLLGWPGQRTAEAASEAWLLVAGCPVRLK